jgi:hypothetical protein
MMPDQIDPQLAKREARRAKILKAGEARLGGITNAFKAAEEPRFNDIAHAETTSSQDDVMPITHSIHLVEDICTDLGNNYSQPSFKSLDDTFIPTFTFDSSVKPTTVIDEFEMINWLHGFIFMVISSISLLSWIVATGNLNHPKDFNVETLTTGQWMNQVCRNMVFMSYNPVLHSMGPPTKLEVFGTTMPIWGAFLSIEFCLLSIKWMNSVAYF